MKKTVIFSKPEKNIYTADVKGGEQADVIPSLPIKDYTTLIRPARDKAAVALGEKCAEELKGAFIADFERSLAYCERNHEENPDIMVHVSTFIIINGIVYMTYYANTATEKENPKEQAARLAFCPLDAPADMTVVELQRVGDELDGKKIEFLYDTILMYKGGDELYLMWTASPENNYYRLYRTFNLKTMVLSPIKANRFKVGNIVNDFSISGMQAALSANSIAFKKMWSDIGIMQKLSSRVENGVTQYYTGAYTGSFNCIIKSSDFITWEYVSAPDFINNSLWENATYALGDKIYYFVRQQECEQGFLTIYDLTNGTWSVPADAQSRSDFFYYNEELYLVHAPVDRNGIGIVRINTADPSKSEPVLVADMKSSCFYPFVGVYGDELFISYTVDRKHIRLSKLNLKNYIGTGESS